MPLPAGIGAVDLMIGFPSADARSHYENLRAMTKDAASAEMEFPAEYMFEEMPGVGFTDEVWPKFLRGNAMRVFTLGESA
jgi:hypothetical protein